MEKGKKNKFHRSEFIKAPQEDVIASIYSKQNISPRIIIESFEKYLNNNEPISETVIHTTTKYIRFVEKYFKEKQKRQCANSIFPVLRFKTFSLQERKKQLSTHKSGKNKKLKLALKVEKAYGQTLKKNNDKNKLKIEERKKYLQLKLQRQGLIQLRERMNKQNRKNEKKIIFSEGKDIKSQINNIIAFKKRQTENQFYNIYKKFQTLNPNQYFKPNQYKINGKNQFKNKRSQSENEHRIKSVEQEKGQICKKPNFAESWKNITTEKQIWLMNIEDYITERRNIQ